MKKVFIVLALVLVLVAPLSAARYSKTNGIGVGLSGGYPVSGVAFKYGMQDFRLVGTVGYNYGGGISAELGAQYDVYQFDIGELPFYVSAGVTGTFFASTDFQNLAAGGQGFGALSYFFEAVPIEVFLKAGAGVTYPFKDAKIKFDYGAALGALWYFD
ncbi:MAG: hypothetical protein ACOXZZ_05640 [Sphaerochaetaceae bacterium]|jgi:hypothetical protein